MSSLFIYMEILMLCIREERKEDGCHQDFIVTWKSKKVATATNTKENEKMILVRMYYLCTCLCYIDLRDKYARLIYSTFSYLFLLLYYNVFLPYTELNGKYIQTYIIIF